jgi:phage gp36-like protein
MINGFVANRYAGALPLQTVPPQLVTIATLLTKYFLYELKSAVDEKIQKMYDNQVSLLKQISNGTFKLLELETTAPVRNDGVQFTNKTPADRVFASPEGYFT